MSRQSGTCLKILKFFSLKTVSKYDKNLGLVWKIWSLLLSLPPSGFSKVWPRLRQSSKVNAIGTNIVLRLNTIQALSEVFNPTNWGQQPACCATLLSLPEAPRNGMVLIDAGPIDAGFVDAESLMPTQLTPMLFWCQARLMPKKLFWCQTWLMPGSIDAQEALLMPSKLFWCRSLLMPVTIDAGHYWCQSLLMADAGLNHKPEFY